METWKNGDRKMGAAINDNPCGHAGQRGGGIGQASTQLLCRILMTNIKKIENKNVVSKESAKNVKWGIKYEMVARKISEKTRQAT